LRSLERSLNFDSWTLPRFATQGAWRELLERHHALVRRQLARFRGKEVDTAGDGFFASFDGPARAIRCACAIVDSVREVGLEVRSGLHTGECELVEGKVAGIAVHTGARVAAHATPSEVLVSSTVKDLVAGSGLSFHAGHARADGDPRRVEAIRRRRRRRLELGGADDGYLPDQGTSVCSGDRARVRSRRTMSSIDWHGLVDPSCSLEVAADAEPGEHQRLLHPFAERSRRTG
jgi:class 3 adenylate cyclase